MAQVYIPSPDEVAHEVGVPTPSEGEQTEEHKPKRKVVNGDVVSRKRHPFVKAIETLIYDDASELLRYIVSDIVRPALRDLLHDAIVGGADKAFYNRNFQTANTRSAYTPYGSYSRPVTINTPSGRTTQTTSTGQTPSHYIRSSEVDDWIVNSRREAEDVIYELKTEIEEYDSATLSYLKDILDPEGIYIHRSYMDNEYGWFKLGNVPIRTTKVLNRETGELEQRYMILLPRPVYLH